MHASENKIRSINSNILHEQKKIYRFEIIQEIQQINQIAFTLLNADVEEASIKTSFYTLMNIINNFVLKYRFDLIHNYFTKFQLIMLVAKLKHIYADSEGSRLMIDTFAKYCFENFLVQHDEKLFKSFLDYEVCCYLNLESILSAQKKFQVGKIRNVELYSELINSYEKSTTPINIIELYFEKHRDEILKKIINQDYKINQIHFDEKYLQYYIINSNIYKLNNENFQYEFEKKLVKSILI